MYRELFLIALVTAVSFGCQQLPADDYEGKVKFSALVATGEITDSISDTSFQMTLKCIFKDNGKQPSTIINITHTSNNVDGRCFINNFQRGKSYLVFLRYNKPNYTPLSNEEELSKVADVLKVCGLGVVSNMPRDSIDSSSMSSACQDVQTRPCRTTVPPATTQRTKKPPATTQRTKNPQGTAPRTKKPPATTPRTKKPPATTPRSNKPSPALPLTTKHPITLTTFAGRHATVTSQPRSIEVKDKAFPDYNNAASASLGRVSTTWYIMWYITWCAIYRTDV